MFKMMKPVVNSAMKSAMPSADIVNRFKKKGAAGSKMVKKVLKKAQ